MFETILKIINSLGNKEELIARFNVEVNKYSGDLSNTVEYLVCYRIDDVFHNISIYDKKLTLFTMDNKIRSGVGSRFSADIPEDKHYSILSAVERLHNLCKKFTENAFKNSLYEINK